MEAHPLILGLNPAWQTVLSFDHYQQGTVNRSSHSISYASGKGVNCARVLQKLGGVCELVQFGGGVYGELHLQDLKSAKLPVCHIPIQAPTRQAITLREAVKNPHPSDFKSGFDCTELIGTTPVITPEEEELLLQELQKRLPQASEVVICGTFPQGLSTEFWGKWLKNCEIPVILDGVSGVECILESAVVALLKVNEEEILRLNESLPASSNSLIGDSSAGDSFGSATAKATEAVARAYGLQECIVTRGGDAVLYYSVLGNLSPQMVEVAVPKPSRIRNVIGAGDSFLAGLLWWRQRAGQAGDRRYSGVGGKCGEDREDCEAELPPQSGYSQQAVLFAIATASARVEEDLPWEVHTNRVEEIFGMLENPSSPGYTVN